MLRRVSTRRLLTWCAAVAAVLACGGAIAAGALGGSGPVPPPKGLANAIHDALAAPAPAGISADVQFSNHLIDSGLARGTSPLLTGASGRLWAADRHLRIELQAAGESGSSDSQLLVADRSFSFYDASSNTVYRGQLPADSGKRRERPRQGVPSIAEIQRQLDQALRRVAISGPTRGSAAGRPRYSVHVTPRGHSGLVGGASLGWDAATGVPLDVGIYARGASAPVISLAVTNITYGPVAASTFAVTPPPGAKVVDLGRRSKEARVGGGRRQRASGVAAVQRALPFALAAPASVDGMARGEVRLLGGHTPAALVLYGDGLDGVAVIERVPSKGAGQMKLGSGRDSSLPTVNVGGTSATEIATPLGTLISFHRGGVEYTVVGSVTKATAEAAARGL